MPIPNKSKLGPLFTINPDMPTDDPRIRQQILDRTLERRKTSAWDRHCKLEDKRNKQIQDRAFWSTLIFCCLISVVLVAGIVKLFWR